MAGSDLTSGIPAPIGTTEQWDPQQWGGQGRAIRSTNGWDQQYVPGSSGAEQDVARYRNMGAAGPNYASIDPTQTDASRAYQVGGLNAMQGAMGNTADAMGLARSAAMGQQPSAAEIYGGKMIDDSINSQMAMANSARGGPGAIAAAQRAAAFQGAQTQQAGTRDLAALRANEMSDARNQYGNMTNIYGQQAGAYGQQANAIRGADYNQAYGQAQLDNSALDRAQQNQQYYEGMGWNTNNAALQANMAKQKEDQQAWNDRQAMLHQTNQDDWNKDKDIFGAAGSFIGSVFSDVRAKADIYPLSGGIERRDPYTSSGAKAPTPTPNVGGDIIRENPYGAAPAQPSAGLAMLRGIGAAATGFGAGRMAPVGSAYMPIRSDENAKTPMSGPAMASYESVGGGAENVLGSARAMSNVATRFMNDPSGMRSDARSKYIYSDARAKEAAYEKGRMTGQNEAVNAAREANDYRNVADDGVAYTPALSYLAPGLAGFGAAHGIMGNAAAYFANGTDAFRSSTPAKSEAPVHELASAGVRTPVDTPTLQDAMRDPVANANRAQEASVYTYKPEFAAESGQAPGETNVGPMAQTMASDPVAATAVKQGPDGYLMLDGAKLAKLHSAGIASLQKQVDVLRGQTYPTRKR